MKYYILDSRCREPNKPFKTFNKKADCKEWIMCGLYGTEGLNKNIMLICCNNLIWVRQPWITIGDIARGFILRCKG